MIDVLLLVFIVIFFAVCCYLLWIADDVDIPVDNRNEHSKYDFSIFSQLGLKRDNNKIDQLTSIKNEITGLKSIIDPESLASQRRLYFISKFRDTCEHIKHLMEHCSPDYLLECIQKYNEELAEYVSGYGFVDSEMHTLYLTLKYSAMDLCERLDRECNEEQDAALKQKKLHTTFLFLKLPEYYQQQAEKYPMHDRVFGYFK
jgi:hypothetical protein